MDIDDARAEFGPFEDHVWLNCAHQGPLPRVAQEAAQAAIREKALPHLMEEESFWTLPEQLRGAIASFIGAVPSEVILGNATSYGLNLLCHGLPLESGDEVLLVDGDFPATVTSWLPLRERGVDVRLITPTHGAPTAEEVESEIGPNTRVLCCSWVFSFTGQAVDLDAIGSVCRSRNVLFVVNATQGVGARPLDVSRAPIDALVAAGFKWLCGPYATGFCWMRPQLLQQLVYEQRYWLAQMDVGDLSREGGYELSPRRRARDYDLFCTANFLTFRPWLASLQLLSRVGVEAIEEHDQRLVDLLVEGIADHGLELLSPTTGPTRSTLVYMRAENAERTSELYRALRAARIGVALRQDQIRVAPHLYNTPNDIDRLFDACRRALGSRGGSDI